MSAPNATAPTPTTSAPSTTTPNTSAPTASAPPAPVPTASAPIVSAAIVSVPVVSAPEPWQHDLFGDVCGGDCNTCLGSWFFTSCLYGRAAQRLDMYPRNDPMLLQTISGHCGIFYCTSPCCAWLPVGLKREQVRERFNIEGNLCQDFAASMFCMSCTVAQMNTELKDRAAKANLGMPIGYQSQTQGMVYLPPNQQPVVQQPPLQQQPQLQEKKPIQQGV